MSMKDEDGSFNAAFLDYVRRGRVEWMQSFLQNDNPELIDLNGKTLLHFAAESDNVPMIQHFINNHHNLDIVDVHGNSPLMMAVKNGSFKAAILLVKAGANIYSCNSEVAGILLNEARSKSENRVENKYYEFIRVILQKLRKDCWHDEQLLLTRLREIGCSLVQAISLRDANVTRLMLENGYSVDEREPPTEQTALHRAAYLQDLQNVRVLTKFGASVDAMDINHDIALYCLFQNQLYSREDEEKRVEIMKILIEYEGLSSKTPCISSEFILEHGGLLAIDALMQYDIEIFSGGFLWALIDNWNDDVLEVFRDKNIAHRMEEDGKSVLSSAVGAGSLRKVRFLLEHGADPSFVDIDGETPLLSAFTYCDTTFGDHFLAIVRLLLQYGANAQNVITNGNREEQTVFDIESRVLPQALESVVAHLALMESCGEIISDLIRQKIDSHGTFKEYFQICKGQLDEMKETTINGRVTLYKLLIESHVKITRYARDLEFTSKFNEAMRNQQRLLDPYYSISLYSRVGKAIRAAELEEDVRVVFKTIFPCCFKNCHEIFDKILDYLNWNDLKIVCRIHDFDESESFKLDTIFV